MRMADNTISFKVEGDPRVHSIDVDQTHAARRAASNDIFIRDYIRQELERDDNPNCQITEVKRKDENWEF